LFHELVCSNPLQRKSPNPAYHLKKPPGKQQQTAYKTTSKQCTKKTDNSLTPESPDNRPRQNIEKICSNGQKRRTDKKGHLPGRQEQKFTDKQKKRYFSCYFIMLIPGNTDEEKRPARSKHTRQARRYRHKNITAFPNNVHPGKTNLIDKI
jgi:hypothetical protein